MKLESIALCEVSQTQTHKYHVYFMLTLAFVLYIVCCLGLFKECKERIQEERVPCGRGDFKKEG